MNRNVRDLIARLRSVVGLPQAGRKVVGDDLSKIFAEPSGWTIFDDVALRLKSLTTEELDAARGDPGAYPGAFKIRLARSTRTHREADKLLKEKYAQRRLQTAWVRHEPNVSTFVAYDEGRLAGTVSIRMDSPTGLAADGLYRDEISAIRNEGYRVCEFTRLAVDASRVSKPVIAALFHTAYLYAYKIRGVNFAVIEVNPRHVAYYRRALGFDVVGPERHNTRVNAPAVLLCTPFEAIAEGLHRHAGRRRSSGSTHNLYAYGFTAAEEAGIFERLRALDAD